jgi:hypothetical protein
MLLIINEIFKRNKYIFEKVKIIYASMGQKVLQI